MAKVRNSLNPYIWELGDLMSATPIYLVTDTGTPSNGVHGQARAEGLSQVPGRRFRQSAGLHVWWRGVFAERRGFKEGAGKMKRQQ
jgi:hypothetical protein